MNEILNLMANQVLRNVIGKVRSSPSYAVMADEYRDVANRENLSIYFRAIDLKELTVTEYFSGFYEIK